MATRHHICGIGRLEFVGLLILLTFALCLLFVHGARMQYYTVRIEPPSQDLTIDSALSEARLERAEAYRSRLLFHQGASIFAMLVVAASLVLAERLRRLSQPEETTLKEVCGVHGWMRYQSSVVLLLSLLIPSSAIAGLITFLFF